MSSYFLVKDTVHHVKTETRVSQIKKLQNVFRETTWTNPNLASITQAGLVNNLNDGMIWGLFPVLLNIKGFGLADVGRVVAIYPIVWGLGQLITGRLADIWNKKSMLFWGMLIQGMAIITMIFASSFVQFTLLSTLLGIGTVVVYPTFLAAIADYTHPEQRAKSIGVFRLWRDSGYAIGAVLTGIIADFFGINISIIFIGLITLLSSLVIKIRMK